MEIHEEIAMIQHFLYTIDLRISVYILLVITIALFLYGVYESYRRWTYGGERIKIDNVGTRLKNLLIYGIRQRRVTRKPFEGAMHFFIFWGTIGLFTATILRAFEYDILMEFFEARILVGYAYLIFKLMANIAGLLLLIGLIMALAKRVSGKPSPIENTLEDHLILLTLLVIVVTGFILDGIATYTYRYAWINGWDFIGTTIASTLSGVNIDLAVTYRTIWVIHMVLALTLIATLPYTKLYHIVAGGIFNIFLARLDHPASFKPVYNIEKIIEEGGYIGAKNVKDLSWKQRMDLDACVRCGRCESICPASISGKPLSPMKLILNIRRLMRKSKFEDAIVDTQVKPDAIWSCVTCGACVYECPLLIHHVETIIDFRRALFSEGEKVPKEAIQTSYNVMRTGNPYGLNPFEKEEWVKSIPEKYNVPIAEEGKEYDYLLWIGCNGSYDPKLRTVVEKFIQILKMFNVNFALILDEQCCGEPVRRIGDELLFTEIVKIVKEILSKYKFRKIITMCPHGYNVFRNEYPKYGFKVDVEHYTQTLSRLLEREDVKLKSLHSYKVTFHDPCYLGRWNGILEEPRNILKKLDVKLVEMPHNRDKSLCCGGGGGQAFYEVKEGERISSIRAKEVIGTKANKLVVACPICNIMFSGESILNESGIEVIDIVELVHEALIEH